MKPEPPDARSKGTEAATGLPGPPRAGGDADARVRALVERARGGDQDAFRELVERHQDRAFGLALRITRSRADAEDVAQEAFVRAWRALPRFRGESSFATWLHRIVARRALDRLAELQRRRGREVGVEDPALVPAAGEAGAGAGGDVASEMRARRIEQMVRELPAAQRAAVTLYYYEDRSVAQVAEMLGMPENTVKTHLARARAALRAAWPGEEP